MKAILSDIHGNLEALQAVLADLDRHPIEAVYCLGDVIGYGPNPRECLEVAMTWPVVLLGNHEQAVVMGPQNFNPTAEQAILWTRGQIDAPLPSPEAARRRLAFLEGLPLRHHEDGLLFVHGSAYDPVNEYVFPEDVRNGIKMWTLFMWVDRWCFQGHTHVPGVFTETQFFSPEAVAGEWRLGGKAMINVGSVGQPRDGDRRACYVLLDGDVVRFRRVEYDFTTTTQKIHAIAELPDALGDRLGVGR